MDMFDKVFEDDRVFIHAHFGTNDIDDIFAKLRYLIVGCDCRWVVVDHLHMLVSATTEGDERRAIDNINDKVAKSSRRDRGWSHSSFTFKKSRW